MEKFRGIFGGLTQKLNWLSANVWRERTKRSRTGKRAPFRTRVFYRFVSFPSAHSGTTTVLVRPRESSHPDSLTFCRIHDFFLTKSDAG